MKDPARRNPIVCEAKRDMLHGAGQVADRGRIAVLVAHDAYRPMLFGKTEHGRDEIATMCAEQPRCPHDGMSTAGR